MVGKSGENILLNKAEESNTLAMSKSESADSEMLELDVKVCDICGDAGREDLLAICSRCSDGAEHIYCMRVMLSKVPEGDWLCEECKFAEDEEKRKLETKGKRESEVNVNTQSSSKRDIEAAPDSKRQQLRLQQGHPTTTSTTGVVLTFMAGTTTSIEEHRSSSSHKPQDEMVNQEDDAASLTIPDLLTLEKEQQEQQNERSVSGWEQKKQNVNTRMFLFRGFPDKSS